jgi:hypothetical protein
MGVDAAIFYDARKVAILPMGFCYLGAGKSGDLPPRPECAVEWRSKLLGLMPAIELTLLIGQGHVRLAPIEADKIIPMDFDPLGAPITAHRRGGNISGGFEARDQAHRAGDADAKTPGRRIARHALLDNRLHNPFSKIVGKRHVRRLLRAADSLNQISDDSGIGCDSARSDTALGASEAAAFEGDQRSLQFFNLR